MECYKLRPHHGICFQFYRGKGYSKEFTDNMDALNKLLTTKQLIQIQSGLDSVCRKCPNSDGTACSTQEKVEWLDQKVMEGCGLKPGQVLMYGEFSTLVLEKLIRTGKWNEICRCCSWYSYCKEIEEQDEITQMSI